MKPKLILVDLDGTLLHDDKSLSPANRAALERVAGQGAQVVVATGRFYGGVPGELLELPFLRYFILMNGAKVYDRREDRVLYRREIPQEVAQQVFAMIRPLDATVDCYQNDLGLMDRRYLDRLDYYVPDPESRRLVQRNRIPVDDFEGTVRRGGDWVQKIQCLFPDPSLRPGVMEQLRERFPELVLSYSLPGNLEINQAGATKGEALAGLCRALSIPLEESAAFGDGTNDLTMIRTAGTGVAMANGDPAVRAAAYVIAPSNQEDGVARVLERWFGTGE